jgi:hypothetical protein
VLSRGLNLSGERIVLIGEAKYGTLAEKHAFLSDLPGPKSGRVGVVEKIEGYLIDVNHLNRKELRRRTPFLSKDQHEHIEEEVKAAWALRKPYKVDGYRVEPQLREGSKNISIQYSFRNLKTGRFEKPKEKKDGA